MTQVIALKIYHNYTRGIIMHFTHNHLLEKKNKPKSNHWKVRNV